MRRGMAKDDIRNLYTFRNIKNLFKRYEVKLAYLFGSQVSDETDKFSDIDIGVVFTSRLPFHKKMEVYANLSADLEKVIAKKGIDLIFMDEVPIELQFQIISTGKIIFSANEYYRFKYESYIQSVYMDLKPFLEKSYSEIMESFKEEAIFDK
jgi:predicted nucleotidyltransferase